MAIKINVQKSYEELDIAGVTYILDMNDEKMKGYVKAFHKYEKEAKKLAAKDFTDMTEAEQAEATDMNREIMEEILDLLLGEGSFAKIYRDTGKSLMVVAHIILQIMDVVGTRAETFKNQEKAYYTGK
jgi:hypothetical protein